MPKKSYRRRNRGGDDEVPKKPVEEPFVRPRDENGRFTPKEPVMDIPQKEELPVENNLEIPPAAPPPQEDSWFSPKKPVEAAPPPQALPAAPPPKEEAPQDSWFSPKKPVEAAPPQQDSWFSPPKPAAPPLMQEEPLQEESIPENPSIFTLGFIIALVFSLIAIIMLSIGIYILARKPTYPSETTGTVKTAKCVNNNCIMVIEFTPEGATDKLTSNELQISGNYNKGDSVKINYNPDNPSTFGVNLTSPKVFGWSFIGVSLLLLLIIWGIYYFTRR